MTASGSRLGPIAGVILAAGESKRMGRPKQLLPLAGKPLLQRVVDEAARSSFDQIVVVLGGSADEISAALTLPTGASIVVNPDYASGMGSSLQIGVRSIGERAVAAAVLLGDQPGVHATAIDRVIAAYRSSDRPIVRALYRDADGRRVPGHPVIVDAGAWRLTDDIAGDEGLRGIISKHADWVLDVDLDAELPPDIDTRADYERMTGEGGAGLGGPRPEAST